MKFYLNNFKNLKLKDSDCINDFELRCSKLHKLKNCGKINNYYLTFNYDHKEISKWISSKEISFDRTHLDNINFNKFSDTRNLTIYGAYIILNEFDKEELFYLKLKYESEFI